jgi:predicted TIM-barrel fold metal-dependent hydrolase
MINLRSELAQRFWEKGKLDDCPILDFHAHMGDNGGIFLPKRTPEAMISTMDSCNTLITCFCGHETLFMPSIGVKKDIEAVKKYPNRFKAYHGVVSNFTDPESDLRRMEENPDIFVGFKFLCDYYSTPLSDPKHEKYWEYADDNKLLVLCHTWKSPYDGVAEAEKVLEKYHNLILIAGHSFHSDWDKAVELVKKYPNLYLELTAVLDDRGPLDMFVKEIGSEKILFGTDLPWFSTHHGIGAVLSAEMTDDDRRNIFYRNGARLLSRFTWFEKIWEPLNLSY